MVDKFQILAGAYDGTRAQIGSLSDLKIKISDFLPDDTIIMNQQSFEKLKRWYNLDK